MKLGAISDIHGNFPAVSKCDIFVIAGDISPEAIEFNMPEMKKWMMTNFLDWIKEIPAKRIVLIAGNHDVWLNKASSSEIRELIKQTDDKLIYLENQACEIEINDETWKIFGTPYCHIFGPFPFMHEEHILAEKFAEIPEEIDILISHDPPFGTSNADVILESKRKNRHVGNKELTKRLDSVKYKLHICGHIHSGSHELENSCVNVSFVNENYEVWYSVFYKELAK